MFSQLGEAFPLGNASSYNECLKLYVTVQQTVQAVQGAAAVVSLVVWCPLFRQVLVVVKPLTSGQVSRRVGL